MSRVVHAYHHVGAALRCDLRLVPGERWEGPALVRRHAPGERLGAHRQVGRTKSSEPARTTGRPRAQRGHEPVGEVSRSGGGRAVDRDPPPSARVALQHESDDVVDESGSGHGLEVHRNSVDDAARHIPHGVPGTLVTRSAVTDP
jgi:hypothetical protein